MCDNLLAGPEEEGDSDLEYGVLSGNCGHLVYINSNLLVLFGGHILGFVSLIVFELDAGELQIEADHFTLK
jgi:hypothetical protein